MLFQQVHMNSEKIKISNGKVLKFHPTLIIFAFCICSLAISNWYKHSVNILSPLSYTKNCFYWFFTQGVYIRSKVYFFSKLFATFVILLLIKRKLEKCFYSESESLNVTCAIILICLVLWNILSETTGPILCQKMRLIFRKWFCDLVCIIKMFLLIFKEPINLSL